MYIASLTHGSLNCSHKYFGLSSRTHGKIGVRKNAKFRALIPCVIVDGFISCLDEFIK
jgi:hypothetical protein